MSALLSNTALLSSIGVMILAAAIVVVAIWTAVLSVKVSKLKKMVLMEQERSAELARKLSMQGKRGPGAATGVAGGAQVSPSGMPLDRASDGARGVAAAEDERPKKQRSRKGKPTIPFGANKEAQSRARQAYEANADLNEYDPDSIDFDKVEGLRTPQVGMIPPDAHPVRSASPVGSEGTNARQQARTREPRMRTDAHPLDQQTTGKMPTVTARQATAETKASFDRVNEELRSHNGTSSAWVEDDARRVVERHERAARRQRLSERRQHEQLRRQAESIVAEHHRQMSEVNAN